MKDIKIFDRDIVILELNIGVVWFMIIFGIIVRLLIFCGDENEIMNLKIFDE